MYSKTAFTQYTKRPVPLLDTCDVLVAGGGPAGLCAAVAAARAGMRTILVERYGVVGGNLTVGHVGPVMGSVARGTLRDEVIALLGTDGACVAHDVELAKIRLTRWLKDAGVVTYVQTAVTDAWMDAGKIQGLFVTAARGLEVIEARVVIDATGDGTVAALSGSPYQIGRNDGMTQPGSIMFTLAGIDPLAKITCCHEEDDTFIDGCGSYLGLCKRCSSEGELPDSVTIVRLYPTSRPGERMVNASQINGVNGILVSDVERSQLELRRQTLQIRDFLRRHIPGFENSYVCGSSDHVGFRETRRIQGEYTLQDEDVTGGKRFEDVAVHRANFCIDIHNPQGGGQAESEGCPVQVHDYDIPYRCFIPVATENLLLSGRCISGTHRAHASYRVMSICMAIGHAAGAAAALCCQGGVQPRALDYRKLQGALSLSGVNLWD